jgi:hypothetical protein
MTRPASMEPSGTAAPMEFSGEVRVPPSPRRADVPASPATRQSTQQPAKPRMQPERNAPVSDGAPWTAAATANFMSDAEQPAIAEADTFQPLVASPQRRVVSTPPPAPQANANRQGQANATTQPSEAISPPRHQVTSPERTDLQQTTRPLVPAPRIPVPAMAGARKALPFPPPSQRHPQPPQSLVEEPDSVEIHIGRIEVLAAPSRPAQPAAPQSERKSLDLGEYLRRERRSR